MQGNWIFFKNNQFSQAGDMLYLQKMRIVDKYFPELTPEQRRQIAMLGMLYARWNEKINVISRKDIENLYERHVLSSLAIAKVIRFRPGTEIMDAGTGGGFPGIPLAILFPEVNFYLIDSVGKKIKVVDAIAQEIGLQNVEPEQVRLEKVRRQFDFIVSRAVTRIPELVNWAYGKVRRKGFNDLPNGIMYLKGGDFSDEISNLRHHFRIYGINQYFNEAFFETKKLVHIW